MIIIAVSYRFVNTYFRFFYFSNFYYFSPLNIGLSPSVKGADGAQKETGAASPLSRNSIVLLVRNRQKANRQSLSALGLERRKN